MNWRRVLAIGAVLALGIAAATFVPVAWHDYRERVAQAPDPEPATDAQQVALLRALVAHGAFPSRGDDIGPNPGQRRTYASLAAWSLSICSREDGTGCGDFDRHEEFLDRSESISGIPLRLRRELALSNRRSEGLPDPKIAGMAFDDSVGARQRLTRPAQAQWPSPAIRELGPPGLAQVSRAVLSDDGARALVLVEWHCGPSCANSRAYLLQLAGDTWRVVAEEHVWGVVGP